MIVCAVVPAHNEENNIQNIIGDLVAQKYKLYKIIVVDDFSTDKTSDIVKKLILKYPEQLVLLKTDKAELRAGAMNKGLEFLKENIKCDFVLSADADCRFDKNVVSEALKSFEKDNSVGGVCSIAGVLNPVFYKKDGILKNVEKWILWRLQRLEYAGFDATRTATWKSVLILHGLCSVFRFNSIIEVGGYAPNHLLEDYKLTLQLKKAGWKTVFNPKIIANTDAIYSIKKLIRQRLRWMIGGIRIILEEGINKYTFEDFFSHIVFIALLITILATVIPQSIKYGWHFHLNFSFLPVTLAIGGYLFSLYNLKYVKNIDIFDIVIRVLILPELLLSIFFSWLQVWAYGSVLLKSKEVW